MLLAVLACASSAQAWAPPEEIEPEAGGVLGLPMETDPALPDKPTPYLFPPGLKATWLTALEQEEVDLRHQVVLAFAEAHEYGLPELQDVPPRLVELLESDPSMKVRAAAAEALFRFDFEQAAAEMFAAIQADAGRELITVADRALAAWDYEPARQSWRERVADETLPLDIRRSAARSLGQVADAGAGPVLEELVRVSGAPVSLRLDAAEALGRAVDEGLVETARSWVEDGGRLEQTLAAMMLRSHRAASAIALLRELIGGNDPGVATVALRSLGATHPEVVLEMRRQVRERDEPNLRFHLIDTLARVPEPGSVRTAGLLLDDPSRAVRWRAREVLVAHGQRAELRNAAWTAIDRAIREAGPHGQEHAVLAAAKLNHTAAAMTIARLLESPHWRVRRAAANAMHELAVPETLPLVFARFVELTERVRAGPAGPVDVEVHHEKLALIMALGVMRYERASDVLREYVPKTSPFASQARAAAIWTLGHLYKDNVDRALARQLLNRMTDTESLEPESDNVRHYAAIALGLMGAEQAVATLDDEREEGGSGYRMDLAFRWAAERITGESRPSIEPPARRPQWFLEPIED